MTDKFPEAFNRFPAEKKKVKNFQELLDHFKAWNIKSYTTRKQTKCLAIEYKKMGGKDIATERVDFERNGDWQHRLRDIITGKFTKEAKI